MSGGVEIVCLGETMALAAPDPPVGLDRARTLVLTHGGAESNVAVSLARLGTRASWCSRLGDDPLGHRIHAELAAAGVDTGMVRFDPSAPTGMYLKDPGCGSTRVFYYRRGSAASRMDASDFARAADAGPRILHVTGITPALSASCRSATRDGIRAARGAGITVSFDVNYRPALWESPADAADVLAELASQCDIVFVGADEAAVLWGSASALEVAERLAGVPVLVVKDGARDAWSFAGDEVTRVSACAVEVLEPVGAGDAFAAGWLHGLLLGLAPDGRLRLGHLIAAEALRSATDHGSEWPPIEFLRAAARGETPWPPEHRASIPGVRT